MTLMEQLSAYVPYNEQEARDRALLLECLRREPEVLTRQNPLAHFTASAWIVNPARTRVLMAYHNIYHSWSWLGGHADGESDLLAVALREAREESGIRSARPVLENIFSLEALTVDGHEKRGAYVSSHLHLNVTYLLEADEEEALSIKPDENSGVRWLRSRRARRRPRRRGSARGCTESSTKSSGRETSFPRHPDRRTCGGCLDFLFAGIDKRHAGGYNTLVTLCPGASVAPHAGGRRCFVLF